MSLYTYLKCFSLSFKSTSSQLFSVKREGIWLTVSHKPSQNETLLLHYKPFLLWTL